MSAERLREAAALMRERAEAATREHDDDAEGWYAHLTGDGRAWVAGRDGKWLSVHGMPNSAVHIAAWHPAVALAVADWLDEEARWVDSGNEVIPAALAVANAYLGNPA